MTKGRSLLRACTAAACLATVLNARALAQADAQTVFLRGVSALHLFEYEDANEAFNEARRIDPGFAMAYWGEAMAYNQPLWFNEDLAKARAVLVRLGSTPEARLAKAPTAREKSYLDAVEKLVSYVDKWRTNGR